MTPRVLLVSVLVMTVLAGCAATNNTGGNTTAPGGGSPPASTISNDQAKLALVAAAQGLPDQVGVNMALTQGSKTLLTIVGAFDNATGTADITMNGDLSSLVPGGGAGMSASELPTSFEIWASKTEYVITANQTAFVVSADSLQQFSKEMGGASGSGSPFALASAHDSPFSAHQLLANLTGDNATVLSVTPSTWKEQPAEKIQAQVKNESGTLDNLTAYLSTSTPPRVLHLESSDIAGLPTGTLASADFTYGADVKVAPSVTATRASGLAYTTKPAEGGDSNTNVWTFTGAGATDPTEVEVVVKNASSMSDQGGAGSMGGMAAAADYSKMPDLFRMKLSDGTATQDDITITFADNDHDSKVSKGDTVTITMGQNAPLANPVLFDAKTGTYVVPGAALWALLGVVGAVALAAGRRRA